MDFAALALFLLQVGPPPGPEVVAISLAAFGVFLAFRAVAGPVFYLYARKSIGAESWFGFLAVISPLLAAVVAILVRKPRDAPGYAAWNPWVMCPMCGTPRGWSAHPCPRCGQFLPGVAPAWPYPAAPPAAGAAPAPQVGYPPYFPPPNPAPAASTGYPPPSASPSAPTERKVVTLAQILGVLAFTTALAVVIGLLMILPTIYAGGTQTEIDTLVTTPGFLLAALLIQDTLLLAVTFDQALLQGRLTVREFGFSLKLEARPWWQLAAAGVGVGAVSFVATVLVGQALIDVGRSVGIPVTDSSPSVLPPMDSLYSYGVALLMGCVIAPLAEEIFFRGYALGGLARRGRANSGLLITSVIFAVAHFNPAGAIPLFVAGLVLGALYLKTGSLVAPIFAHATNNFIVATLVLFGF